MNTGAYEWQRWVRPAACLVILLITAVFGGAPSRLPALLLGGTGTNDDADNVIESFEVERDGDCLLLPVTIGGEVFDFIVDTGCSFCCVDTTLSEYLSPTALEGRLNGRLDVRFYSIRDAVVGEARLPIPGPVMSLDLSGLRRVMGHEISGILGMSFLRSFVIDVDFDRGRLHLLKSAAGISGVVVPLVIDEFGCPTVDVQVDSRPAAPFLVDTGYVGSAGIQVEAGCFDELLECSRRKTAGPGLLSMTLEGVARHREARIEAVTLRRFNHRDLLAVDGPHNAVGLDYLSRFHVTFDFRNAQACLHCGARFDDPSQIDLSGLLLERVDGETTVHAVRDGGAAARAGMVPGDCILSIDGVPATELSMLAVRRAFSADDRILHLTVRRGRRHHAIEFQLPAQFDANVID